MKVLSPRAIFLGPRKEPIDEIEVSVRAMIAQKCVPRSFCSSEPLSEALPPPLMWASAMAGDRTTLT
jgi:hypothetical protein